MREEEQNLKIARMNYNAAVEKMDIMDPSFFCFPEGPTICMIITAS